MRDCRLSIGRLSARGPRARWDYSTQVGVRAAALVFAGWLILFGGAVVAHAAESGGNHTLFRQVAIAHKANRDGVSTWRGRVLVVENIRLPRSGTAAEYGVLQIRRKSNVVFVFDRERKAWRSNWLTTEGTKVTQTGEEESTRPSKATMLTQETYYRCEFDPREEQLAARDGSLIGRAVVLQARSSKRHKMQEFNAMSWFGADGKDLAEFFFANDKWYREGQDMRHISVRRDRDVIMYEMRLDTSLNPRVPGAVINRYVVDLKRGATLRAFDSVVEQPDGNRSTRQRADYQNVSGVWIPKKVTIERENEQNGFFSSETYEWVESILNTPIGEAEFSLVKLDLRQGDRFVDQRTGTSYTIRSAEFPKNALAEQLAGKLRRPRSR